MALVSVPVAAVGWFQRTETCTTANELPRKSQSVVLQEVIIVVGSFPCFLKTVWFDLKQGHVHLCC